MFSVNEIGFLCSGNHMVQRACTLSEKPPKEIPLQAFFMENANFSYTNGYQVLIVY